jgi:hypothetical protein
MTENELTKKKPTPDSVGMGSYTIDSHNVQRYITPEGFVQNEGDIGVGITPYAIAYGSLVPKKAQCENLLVTICVSSSHIAFGSIRMEPVFMILGQSAATAAVMAIDDRTAVQDVPYTKLREQLLKEGQVLEYKNAASAGSDSPQSFVDPKKLPGVVVDDDDAKLMGEWKDSSVTPGYVGNGYRHDDNSRDGKKSARFETRLPKSGLYEVLLAYPPNANRSSMVTVEIQSADGKNTVQVDQRKTPSIDGRFHSLGRFEFKAGEPAVVVVSNANSNGYVVIDAVQWLAK